MWIGVDLVSICEMSCLNVIDSVSQLSLTRAAFSETMLAVPSVKVGHDTAMDYVFQNLAYK